MVQQEGSNQAQGSKNHIQKVAIVGVRFRVVVPLQRHMLT